MSDRIGSSFDFYQNALALRQQRQEILASNIANADTPHYKARDIDFGTALKNAMGMDALAEAEAGGARPVAALPNTALKLTSARHIPAQGQRLVAAEPLYRRPTQPSLDGNTVDMNVERVQFSDNALRYQTDLQVLNARIKSLLTAMQQ